MQPGDVFAERYLIVRLLSSGPMGTVCEAEHTLTRQRVVLKLIRNSFNPRTGDDGSWKVRFRREVRAAAGLESDHAVRVFDAATDSESGISYLVMECLEGEDVGDLLHRYGCVPVDLALRIASQACSGVQIAHDAGVVHRDLKPANLFLAEAEDGSIVVKLLDFGLAKAISEEAGLMSHRDVTDAGGVLGTPSYMSPEQAQEPRDIDFRTDVWSLGAVLHRMLSGRPPVFGTGQGPADMLIALATGQSDPEPIQTLAPWVPPEVAAVVHRALRRDREQRYASVQQLRDDILALLGDRDGLTRDDIVPLSAAQRQVVARPMTAQDARTADRKFVPERDERGLMYSIGRGAPRDERLNKIVVPAGRSSSCRRRFRATMVAVLGLLAATWLFAKEAGVSTHVNEPQRHAVQPIRSRPSPAPSTTASEASPRRPAPSHLSNKGATVIRPPRRPRWTPPIADPGF